MEGFGGGDGGLEWERDTNGLTQKTSAGCLQLDCWRCCVAALRVTIVLPGPYHFLYVKSVGAGRCGNAVIEEERKGERASESGGGWSESKPGDKHAQPQFLTSASSSSFNVPSLYPTPLLRTVIFSSNLAYRANSF